MALISLLCSPEPTLHSNFLAAPFPDGNHFAATAGLFGHLSFRLAGPEHLHRMSGTMANCIWLAEGSKPRSEEKLHKIMELFDQKWPKSNSHIESFYKAVSNCFNEEFTLALISKKTGDAVVINDRLGRLPLYVAQCEHGIMISRQIFHIHQCFNHLTADQIAIGFHLLLGFPLSNATLWNEIKRVMPGNAVIIENNSVRYMAIDDRLHLVHSSTYDRKNAPEHIASMLNKAINSKTDGQETILSMSGGLDSRLLAAALHNNGHDFRMISYSDASGSASADVRCARESAQTIGHQLGVVHLESPSEADFAELHQLKYGLNYSGMAFLLPFLKQMPSNARVLTGDGGDKLLAPLGHLPPLFGIKQLAAYIVRQHGLMPVKTAAALSATEPETLLMALENVLKTNFSNDIATTYAEFLLRQRAFKWLFEGEDRNRWYVDHVAPLWSEELASFLLQIPMAEKAGYRLFKDVLMHYNPKLIAIDNANWGFPLTSKLRLNQLLLKQKIKHTLPIRWLMSIRKHQSATEKTQFTLLMQQWLTDPEKHGQKMIAEGYVNSENLFYIRSLAQCDLLEPSITH